MADGNNTNRDFQYIGEVLTELVGDVRNPDFSALERVKADPFRGPHLGRISDYETFKANLANANPTPLEYERAIRDYVIEREI